MTRSRRRVVVICAAFAVLVGLGGAAPSTTVTAGSDAGATSATAASAQPNVVFVLTDDLSWNLVRYMSQVQQMRREGMTFNNFVVTDSLCCPSRASILSGRFPHDTGIYTNGGQFGGFEKFHSQGEEGFTFATAVQGRGYRTGMMGKYLNGYLPGFTGDGLLPYVPPGWDEWDVPGAGYSGYGYTLNENQKLVRYGRTPADYLTDVLAQKGARFIKRSAGEHKPFLLELATFAPHSPYNPAPRDVDEFPDLTTPRGPAFNNLPTGAPPWLAAAGHTPLSAELEREIDVDFRKRVRSVQAIDDLIATVRRALADSGVADDTYLVFASDNGYHMGEYRLLPGKMTAFDTDIRVPLVVSGPGVPPGTSSDAAVANIDLAPTFEQIAGARVPNMVDGHSLLSLLRGGSDASWRTANLVEHHGPGFRPDDPDKQGVRSGNPPTYRALRTNTYTYVEYADRSVEYYDLVHDPSQMHNLGPLLSKERRAQLAAAVRRLADCHSGPSCWKAGHV
jgi:N-acetylglucosamine-6-sulfatase